MLGVADTTVMKRRKILDASFTGNETAEDEKMKQKQQVFQLIQQFYNSKKMLIIFSPKYYQITLVH